MKYHKNEEEFDSSKKHDSGIFSLIKEREFKIISLNR